MGVTGANNIKYVFNQHQALHRLHLGIRIINCMSIVNYREIATLSADFKHKPLVGIILPWIIINPSNRLTDLDMFLDKIPRRAHIHQSLNQFHHHHWDVSTLTLNLLWYCLNYLVLYLFSLHSFKFNFVKLVFQLNSIVDVHRGVRQFRDGLA